MRQIRRGFAARRGRSASAAARLARDAPRAPLFARPAAAAPRRPRPATARSIFRGGCILVCVHHIPKMTHRILMSIMLIDLQAGEIGNLKRQHDFDFSRMLPLSSRVGTFGKACGRSFSFQRNIKNLSATKRKSDGEEKR